MRKLYIMQGIPGSGKSYMAQIIVNSARTSSDIVNNIAANILSTDDYWLTTNGDYQFDPARLHDAHRWNQIRCITAMEAGVPLIIIDNTNIRRRHARPYVMFAETFGYDVEVVRVSVSIEKCIERQALRPESRRVPEEVIRKMATDMQDLTEEL